MIVVAICYQGAPVRFAPAEAIATFLTVLPGWWWIIGDGRVALTTAVTPKPLELFILMKVLQDRTGASD